MLFRGGFISPRTWVPCPPQGGVIFIFIGGLQPKKVQVDDNPRTCPVCGLATARLKRLDHYISLFFIPLIPVKRGEPFVECNRCKGVFDQTGRPQYAGRAAQARCPYCGALVQAGFQYCPQCGKRL